MSAIPTLIGRRLQHTFQMEHGDNTPAYGDALFGLGIQTIAMANATVTLVIGGPGSGQTRLMSNTLAVTPGGTGNPKLILPTVATLKGKLLCVLNVSGSAHAFRARDSGDTATVVEVAQNRMAFITSDGTNYRAIIGATGAGSDFGAAGLLTDVIGESTTNAGVTIDGLLIKDEGIDMSGSGVATGDSYIKLKDNLADALSIHEGANDYIVFVTTDSSEKIQVLKTLDLDNTIDADIALTTTGDGWNQLTTFSHATQSGESLDITFQQLTNARTAGAGLVVKGTAIGLAGDTSGATYVVFDANITKNGGSSLAYGYRQAAGFDGWADLSACATGEADVLLSANKAIALQFRQAADTYLTVVTTTGSEAIVAEKRLSTTDGVASGPTRIIGGTVSVAVAAGTAKANTDTNEAVLGSYTVPANTFKAGTRVRVQAMVRSPTTTGTDTLTVRLRLGTTTLIGTLALQSTAPDQVNDDCSVMDFTFVSRAVPGAAAAIVGHGFLTPPDAAGTAAVGGFLIPTNFATNGALLIEVTGQWSATTATCSCQLESMIVEITG